MKLSIQVAAIVIVSIVASTAAAQASCPTRMDSLKDFARCMVPLKGTIGTATVYSSGRYDSDHAALMSAMSRSDVVPQQVMPASIGMTYPYYGYFSPASYANLYFAGHSSYQNNWFRFASFYSPYYRYNPNMWLYAYYRP